MATFGNMNIKITRDSSDHKGMPLEVEVEYYGVKHIISGNNMGEALRLYLLSERSNLSPEELIEQVRAIDGVVQQVQQPVQQVQQVKQETKEKESKVKVKSVGKGLLALVAAGAILFSGYTIIKNLSNNKGEEEIIFDGTDPIPVYEQVTPEIVYTTPEPVTGNNVIAPPVSIPGSENLPYINRSSSDWISMTDAEYLEALNSQTIACQMNMPEISLFLEGEPLEGSKQLTNIQKTFKPGSVDYCIVEYFNQYRNEVVNAAYDTRDIENTRSVLIHHMTEMYLFCTNQKKITLNTNDGVHEYYWSDLSYEARNAVLDVMFSFVIAMPHDYAVTINGVLMYPQNIADFYEGQLATLTLVNPTNRR